MLMFKWEFLSLGKWYRARREDHTYENQTKRLMQAAKDEEELGITPLDDEFDEHF